MSETGESQLPMTSRQVQKLQILWKLTYLSSITQADSKNASAGTSRQGNDVWPIHSPWSNKPPHYIMCE